MPHDRRGKELKAGDRVTIEAIVETVQAGVDYCNVTLKTIHPMPPYTAGTTITLNTQQVELAPEATSA